VLVGVPAGWSTSVGVLDAVPTGGGCPVDVLVALGCGCPLGVLVGVLVAMLVAALVAVAASTTPRSASTVTIKHRRSRPVMRASSVFPT
jgi:hypothetical protein